MVVVVQRVFNAKVGVSEKIVSEISKGLLCYVSYRSSDDENVFRWIIHKILNLRIFPNDETSDRFDLSVKDVHGEILVISNFTLHANCKKGLRPDFIQASSPILAREQHQQFLTMLSTQYPLCKDGQFGALMNVSSINYGPVTIILSYGEGDSI
ncbi:MAG: D-aminoacyl-tRNA deacylase [bacterium]|nr:D-aminoacyl-tRNA deacylase [bacterium]